MYDKLSIILRTRSMQNESTLIVVEVESIRFLVEGILLDFDWYCDVIKNGQTAKREQFGDILLRNLFPLFSIAC